jgi:hypothetical protein
VEIDLARTRIQRYSGVDLSRVSVRRAESDADFALVAQLRAAGFTRLRRHSSPSKEWTDASDRVRGVFSLIGFDYDLQAVGTLRVQDGRHSGLELNTFVAASTVLLPGEHPAAQFARLSVIKKPAATEVMFGLFKAAWHWCYREKLSTILIATPPWAKPIYDFLLFESLGPGSRFKHDLIGGIEHDVMKFGVQSAEQTWRARGNPLCKQFFEVDHPRLAIPH